MIVEVKYGYIKLIHKSIDLCENAGQVDLECPVKAGEMILTKEIDLPKAIPPVSALTTSNRQSFKTDNFQGKYHVTADVYTKDDVPITCLTADIFFHPGKPGLS